MKREFAGSRRAFLKGAAIAGGVTLALCLGRGRSAASQEKKQLPPEEIRGEGYRLTPHIKKYYETANL
jgi:hypothetical protein